MDDGWVDGWIAMDDWMREQTNKQLIDNANKFNSFSNRY